MTDAVFRHDDNWLAKYIDESSKADSQREDSDPCLSFGMSAIVAKNYYERQAAPMIERIAMLEKRIAISEETVGICNAALNGGVDEMAALNAHIKNLDSLMAELDSATVRAD